MKNKITSIKFISIFIFTLLVIFTFNYNKLIKDNNQRSVSIFKEKIEKKFVYPLGNIVGIKADTDGVLVIGYEEENISYIGGIQVGDNITKINDEEVSSSEDIYKILKKNKQEEIKVGFQRNEKYKEEIIKLKYENGEYKLGLWVRDKISGIGTMTLYDPDTDTFFAIGHAITDVDTNKLLKIKEGYLYNADNLEIIKGNSDSIGKIKGQFELNHPIGRFDNNSNFGIHGNLLSKAKVDSELIELGTSEDIKIGDAVILFEDENRNIRTYDIKIEKIIDDETSNRDMIIKVTDEDLIDFTGGIIQGMSGIPIIQNNKLIGSITHVFKNNPKKGYGIFIDEMLQ